MISFVSFPQMETGVSVSGGRNQAEWLSRAEHDSD